MYNVLIVDDEPLIREGLRTIIEWEELGFTVVDVASDAVETLKKLPELKPHLMIVDIRMPGMNGLELLREVQEQFRPSPRFLILSGYADFEYARTAMHLNVEGYLLKPIDEDELASHLLRVKALMDKEQQEVGGSQDRESLIVKLLSGDAPASAAITEWKWASYEIALIKLQSREEIDAAAIAKVKTLLAKRFDSANAGVVFSADPYLGVLLKNTAMSNDYLRTAYDGIAQACGECGLDFIAVAGGAFPYANDLDCSFERARWQMKHRFLYAGGELHRDLPELPAVDSEDGSGIADDKLFLALDASNPDAAKVALRQMGAQWLAADASEQDVKAGYVSRMSAAISKLSQNRPELRELVQSYNEEVAALYGEYRYEQLLERLFSICAAIADDLREKDEQPNVRKMIEMIHRNSADNLKLETLAEALGYNSSYLGKLFKSTTGENFNTYLDKVRIEKAKELLRQGKKVYQVSEQVGYTNVDYFHAKFRKYVGSSPISFRKAANPTE